MHISTLVDDVQKVVESLRAEHGDFTLAMLYNPAVLNASFSWNLIVAAAWTDSMGRVAAITLIAQKLHDLLEAENRSAISRVTVLATTDPFVHDMTFLYPVATPGAGVPINQVVAGDVSEGSGFIFYSRAARTR